MIVLLSALLSLACWGQVYDTASRTVPSPPPTLPAAGSWFTDQEFKSRIYRLTDENFGPAGNTTCWVDYSIINQFNYNSTRGYVACTNGVNFFTWDPDATPSAVISRTVSNRWFDLIDDQNASGTGGSWLWWDDQNPDWLYLIGYATMKVWRYDVAQHTATLLQTITEYSAETYYPDQMYMSRDRNRWTVTLIAKSGTGPNFCYVGEFEPTPRMVFSTYQVTDGNTDGCLLDWSGNWLLDASDATGPGHQYFDLRTQQEYDGGSGHTDVGPGRSASMYWGGPGDMYIFYRLLNNPTVPIQVFHEDFAAGDYSWQGNRHRITASYSGTYTTGKGIDEVFDVPTNGGTPAVRRWARMFVPNGVWNQEGYASSSFDGKFKMFNSTWQDKGDPPPDPDKRKDVFIIDCRNPRATRLRGGKLSGGALR